NIKMINLNELGLEKTQNEEIEKYILNQISSEEREIFNTVISSRQELMKKMLDPRRDIDHECGYHKDITKEEYQLMYEREHIAKRVNDVYSKESWQVLPKVSEPGKEPHETDF